MNTTYNSFFDTVALDAIIPDQIAPRFITPVVTKATVKREASPVPAMSASLWRHTQNGSAAESRHQFVARAILAGIAALGFGSTAYAVWQTGVLMSGSHLQNAISAFLH